MSGVADVLREARALIARGWCKGQFATNKRGTPTDVGAKEAACFCARGAIIRAAGDVKADGVAETRAAMEVWSLLRTGVTRPSIVEWNDAPTRTQADVLAVFDKAIAQAARA